MTVTSALTPTLTLAVTFTWHWPRPSPGEEANGSSPHVQQVPIGNGAVGGAGRADLGSCLGLDFDLGLPLGLGLDLAFSARVSLVLDLVLVFET